jgi:hypothetical protein
MWCCWGCCGPFIVSVELVGVVSVEVLVDEGFPLCGLVGGAVVLVSVELVGGAAVLVVVSVEVTVSKNMNMNKINKY